jgi:hemerythrin superfamily protein
MEDLQRMEITPVYSGVGRSGLWSTRAASTRVTIDYRRRDMDVIALLIADHNRVRGLIARYKEADDTSAKRVLASKMIDELQIHMMVEEKIFYQSVKDRSEEIGEDVGEGYEEHHVAKLLIGEIETLEPGTDQWVAKMTVLIEIVEHHVDEEEDELFPSVRSKSKVEWRNELGDRLGETEADLGSTPLETKLLLTNAALHDLASAESIPGRSSMDHDTLAATVSGEQP